jgi:hypothetical protein
MTTATLRRRSIRVLEKPSKSFDGWGAVEITVDDETTSYLVRPRPLNTGTLVFEVEKLDDQLKVVARYVTHVARDPQRSACECPGFLYHRHCKHLSGLTRVRNLLA